VGGEVTGIIEAVGSNVSGWEVGELCCCSGGGFAEQVRVPAHSLIKLPQDFDVRDFPSPYGYQTAVFALQHRGMLQAGETLLVLGAAGGVGITTVEIGKSMGATVIAAASTDEKLAECRKMGADHLINYSGLDYKGLRDAIRDAAPNGVDVVFDPVRREQPCLRKLEVHLLIVAAMMGQVGDEYTEPCVRNLAENGRYLVVGFAAGDIPAVPANLVLMRCVQTSMWAECLCKESEVMWLQKCVAGGLGVG